jgi:hypothetical protein
MSPISYMQVFPNHMIESLLNSSVNFKAYANNSYQVGELRDF